MEPPYLTHLQKDTKLYAAISRHQPFELQKRNKVYLHLCRSIMGQQLSTIVAALIFKRFLALYDGEEPEPAQILSTPFETLRAIGLSNAKTRYIQNVALFTIEQGINEIKLHEMDNEEIIKYLTQIKGVGRWTVEMLLMFTLGREDVFAVDDLGIQNAMIGIYKLRHNDKKKMKNRMLQILNKWKPYRTYACLHLWHWQNTNGK